MTRKTSDVCRWRPVRNFKHYRINEHGHIYSMYTRRLIKPNLGRNGYALVTLFKNKKRYRKTVASTALESFIGPRPRGFLACHLNDNNWDNHISNLAWQTPEQNVLDRKNNGGYDRSKKQKRNKRAFFKGK